MLITLIIVSCGKSKDQEGNTPPVQPLIQNSISCNNISSFAEDENGMIWIGTFRGLNRYDGKQYYQYFFAEDSTGVPDNQIRDLYVDSRHRMWIATNNGICIHTSTDHFRHVPIESDNKNCNNVFEDAGKHVYLTTRLTVFRYDEKEHHFTSVITSRMTGGRAILKARADRDNRIWVLTDQNLYAFTANGKAVFRGFMHPTNRTSFSNMFVDSNGKLWLYEFLKNGKLVNTRTCRMEPLPTCFQGVNLGYVQSYARYDNHRMLIAGDNGIFLYDEEQQTVTNIDATNTPLKNRHFSPTTLFADSHGNVWMGEPDEGFAVRYAKDRIFNRQNDFEDQFGKQPVTSVAADSRQNLWIASKRNGLIVCPTATRQFRIMTIPGMPNHPYYIYVDHNDHLWLSCFAGTYEYSYDGTALHQLHYFDTNMVLKGDEDKAGNVWLSGNSGNVYCISPTNGAMKTYNLSRKPGSFVPAILGLDDGTVLASVYQDKVYRIDPATGKITDFGLPQDDLKKCIVRGKYIPSFLYCDGTNDIWLGTVGNGLLHFDVRTRQLSVVDGISCHDVSSAEEDHLGNLWISTMYGLNKIDRNLGKVIQYFESDGTGGNQFYDRASCKLADGSLVFAGTHGLTMFKPEEVAYQDSTAIIFQTLSVDNRIVRATKGGIIEQSIDRRPTVHLSYCQNNFTINYNNADYREYDNVHFFYKLEGADRMWVDARNNREATYTSLPAGHYTLRVKIADNLSEKPLSETSLNIVVAPAPWNTWWAWTVYILLAVGLLAYLYRQRMRSYEGKMRMQFFTNVSHEFRTPLSMISGPISVLAESSHLQAEDRKMVTIVQHSISRMLRLVNQMLDFSKLSGDTLKLNVQRMDIIAYIDHLCEIFLFNATEKGITLEKHGLEGCLLTWVDADKLDKILSNLLTNAIKFTPSGGRIDVRLTVVGNNIQLQVEDTGKGLPESQLENIFKLYYQLDNQTRGTINWGTGIGLYYARRLALLHHGSLSAGNRTEGQGAVFTLMLPMDDAAYTAEERTLPDESQEKLYPVKEEAQQKAEPADDNTSRPTVIIVDDDTDVINYLRTLLSPHYHVVYRFGGKEAMEAMADTEPAIVLSDVLMPGTNGYELCRNIKTDQRFCHIPVILLTAKTTVENQIEGLEKGADAYITKPFNPKLLLALIKSQLDNREKLRTLLNTSTTTEKDEEVSKSLSPQDKHFMDELYAIMEKEMMNSELDVNQVAQSLGMSRSKFYYKMKGLTGTNPGAFFRTYKLNRAAEYLREGKYNVSEIADLTGFSSLSFFSTSFKKQFGVSPSEFA